jgi:cell division septation protein DedD
MASERDAAQSGLPFRPRLFLCLALCAVLASSLSAEAGPRPARLDLEGARKAYASAGGGQGKADASSSLSSLADGLAPADALSLLAEFAPGLADPASSKALLERAGRLAILLGDQDAAGDLLEAAALRLPNGRDDGLLLLSARCRLACGDFDKAAERASLVLRATLDRLVSAWAFLFRGDRQDARAAVSIQDPSGPSLEALFIAWASSPDADRPAAAAALVKAFPESAESSIVQSLAGKESAGASSSPRAGSAWAELSPLPQFYLSGVLAADGQASLSAPEAAKPAQAPSKQAAPAAPEPTKAAHPAAPAASGQGQTSGSAPDQMQRYQIGIFSDPENAADLVAELSRKGFKAKTEKRTVKGRDLLSVVVEGDPATILLKLKDAGYEAYQL